MNKTGSINDLIRQGNLTRAAEIWRELSEAHGNPITRQKARSDIRKRQKEVHSEAK